MRILRTIFMIALLGGGVAAAALFLQSQGNAGAQETASEVLDEAVVIRAPLRETIGATSTVAPIRQVSLLFEGTGIVAEVYVREGQVVAAGDPIARLDADTLASAVRDAELLRDIRQIALDALLAPPRTEDIAAAQAALDSAQAQLNAAYSTNNPESEQIAQIQAELARNALYQAQLQRDLAVNPPDVTITQDVPGVGPVTQTIDVAGANPEQFEPSLVQAEYGVQVADASASAAQDRGADAGSVATANAAIVAAQTALDRLVNGADAMDVQMAQIELAQAEQGVALAQSNLDRALLTAPFDGVIATLNITAGEPPAAQTAAAVLIDSSGFYLDLPVDESEIARIEAGQAVEIELDALPDALITGLVTRVPVAPAPQVAGQTVVTYIVRVTLDPTDEMVRAGMTATASIILRELDEALVLPNRFIRIDRDSGQAFVTVATPDGGYTEIPVMLGVRNETTSEIVSGMAEGDRAVLLPRAVFDPVAQNAGGPPDDGN
jgi:HlyD family secretion protein